MPTLDLLSGKKKSPFALEPLTAPESSASTFQDRSSPDQGSRQTGGLDAPDPLSLISPVHPPTAPPPPTMPTPQPSSPGGDALERWRRLMGHPPVGPTSPLDPNPNIPHYPVSGGSGNWFDANDEQGSLFNFLSSHPASSQTLQGLGPELERFGYHLEPPNAQGFVSKVKLPSGQIIRVGDFFDGGGTPAWNRGVPQGSGGSGGGYGSNDVYVNEILSRLQQLRQPINDPLKPLYDLMGLKRIESLSGAPYTAGEDAALRAQYLEPLTQARDAALTRNNEQAGARGFLPSSGLVVGQQNAIEGNYEQAVAGGANDLAVRAINEKQRRADEQLQILSDMLGNNRGFRTEDNQRSQELVDTAARLFGIDQQTLQSLLAASGDGGAQAGNSLDELIRLIMGNQNTQSQNGQNNAAMWGQIIAGIMNGFH